MFAEFETVVETGEYDRLLLGAADVREPFGLYNVHGKMQALMQSFLIMEDMIILEDMSTRVSHGFRATSAASMRASNRRTALACPFSATATRRVPFFSRVCSTRMCGQGRRPAARPRSSRPSSARATRARRAR